MKRRYIIAAVAVLVAAVIVALWEVSRSRTFQFFGEIVARAPTSEQASSCHLLPCGEAALRSFERGEPAALLLDQVVLDAAC